MGLKAPIEITPVSRAVLSLGDPAEQGPARTHPADPEVPDQDNSVGQVANQAQMSAADLEVLVHGHQVYHLEDHADQKVAQNQGHQTDLDIQVDLTVISIQINPVDAQAHILDQLVGRGVGHEDQVDQAVGQEDLVGHVVDQGGQVGHVVDRGGHGMDQ